MLPHSCQKSHSTVILKIHEFTCSLSDGQPASQSAVNPDYAKCRASKITLNHGLPHPIYENVILKTITPLHHGNSFVLPSNAFFSTH